MKVGIKLGKVKKFGIGWCIHHRMAADNAKGGSGQTPPPHGIGLSLAFFQFLFCWIHYCHSSKSTGKETGKMHLCGLA